MKTLVINKENPKGIHLDMTAEEVVSENEALPYEERVVARIRAIYSVDDELAILRQRDTKPHEFSEYNRIVEAIKAEERMV